MIFLHKTYPRSGLDSVAYLSSRLVVPLLVPIKRIGILSTLEEEPRHLIQIILETIKVFREQSRTESHLKHMLLKPDLITDLESAGTLIDLHIHQDPLDLDDLCHQL